MSNDGSLFGQGTRSILSFIEQTEGHLRRAGADVLNSHDPISLRTGGQGATQDSQEAITTAIYELSMAAITLQSATTEAVDRARYNNVTWDEIGKCLSVSKQAAQQHYNH